MMVLNRRGMADGLKRSASLALVAAAALLSACATTPQEKISFEPTYPRPEMLPPASDGAIFQAGSEITLFEDTKARRVGDMITVVLVEKTQASKTASTSTSKDQEMDMDNPVLLGAPLSMRLPGKLPLGGRDLTLENSVNASRTFTGEGDSSQSNRLDGLITVTVADVLSNGYLLVRGEYIRFSGIVRPADIGPDNAVLSTMVADAKISYAGKGGVADANSMGWMSRFFNSKWWPF